VMGDTHGETRNFAFIWEARLYVVERELAIGRKGTRSLWFVAVSGSVVKEATLGARISSLFVWALDAPGEGESSGSRGVVDVWRPVCRMR
jgi:hypothetical protein